MQNSTGNFAPMMTANQTREVMKENDTYCAQKRKEYDAALKEYAAALAAQDGVAYPQMNRGSESKV